ncbi:ribonuclease H-like domain-containing protein, partial [Tanacetum coccineum]
MEVHGAPISKEDINHKFLRSLPPSWNQIALIMRNKPDIDEIDIGDLYNNLRVYEDELKRSLEELDLQWQAAMLTIRVKKFIQRTGRNMDFKEKRPVSLDKSMIECYNYHRKGHFARECRSGRSQGRRPYGDNGRSNVVPPPITRNPLILRVDISFIGLDEYAFRNKIIESKTTKTNKTVGNTNEATIVKPKSVNETVVSKSKINRNEVIIEDWNSDDEDDVCADKTISSVRSQADKSGQISQKQGIDFKKVH